MTQLLPHHKATNSAPDFTIVVGLWFYLRLAHFSFPLGHNLVLYVIGLKKSCVGGRKTNLATFKGNKSKLRQ